MKFVCNIYFGSISFLSLLQLKGNLNYAWFLWLCVSKKENVQILGNPFLIEQSIQYFQIKFFPLVRSPSSWTICRLKTEKSEMVFHRSGRESRIVKLNIWTRARFVEMHKTFLDVWNIWSAWVTFENHYDFLWQLCLTGVK